MTILLYQIGIFFSIQLAAIYNRKSRNVAVLLIIVFTLLQVYTSGLMILQFITIYISYKISKNLITNKRKEKNIERNYDVNQEVGQQLNTNKYPKYRHDIFENEDTPEEKAKFEAEIAKIFKDIKQ